MRKNVLPGSLAFALMLIGCNRGAPPVQSDRVPTSMAVEPSGEYLLIDSARRLVQLRDGGQVLAEFAGAATGAAGTGWKHKQGDAITPVGTFTIGWISPSRKFDRFIGLNYPSLDYAARGFEQGTIDRTTFEAIVAAFVSGRTPPQNTALGGNIGIHGLGNSDPHVHALGVNWTGGCIGLENKQIRELERRVSPGMTVIIR